MYLRFVTCWYVGEKKPKNSKRVPVLYHYQCLFALEGNGSEILI